MSETPPGPPEPPRVDRKKRQENWNRFWKASSVVERLQHLEKHGGNCASTLTEAAVEITNSRRDNARLRKLALEALHWWREWESDYRTMSRMNDNSRERLAEIEAELEER